MRLTFSRVSSINKRLKAIESKLDRLLKFAEQVDDIEFCGSNMITIKQARLADWESQGSWDDEK
ncbi:MAG: hypothetical protein ACYTFW_21425 [Planctomycetota bacterium]|jgi:hypothetical protein